MTRSFDAGKAWTKAKGLGVVMMMMDSLEVKRGREGTGRSSVTAMFNEHFNGPVFFGCPPELVGEGGQWSNGFEELCFMVKYPDSSQQACPNGDGLSGTS